MKLDPTFPMLSSLWPCQIPQVLPYFEARCFDEARPIANLPFVAGKLDVLKANFSAFCSLSMLAPHNYSCHKIWAKVCSGRGEAIRVFQVNGGGHYQMLADQQMVDG